METIFMVLKDGTEIKLESASGINDIRAVFKDKARLVAGWDKLTKENLAQVQIKRGTGIDGTYVDLVPADPVIRAVHERENGLLAVFSLREKTELEKVLERLAAVEETTDILTMEALGGGETL